MPIAIVGMHRSGTSMVTSMLASCGMQMGPESDLMPATKENPTGYFERTSMVNVNDRILHALGAAWDIALTPEDGWLATPELIPLRESARQLVSMFPTDAEWGWKDPRNSVLLPFWEQIIDGRLRMVICLRNPLDVAASLARRGQMSPLLSVRLWQRHTAAARELAATHDAVVTHYDSYFEDAPTELRRVCDAIELEVTDEQIAAAAKNADLSHRHSSSGLSALVNAKVPAEIVAEYVEACAEAGPVFAQAAQRDPLVVSNDSDDDSSDRSETVSWINRFRHMQNDEERNRLRHRVAQLEAELGVMVERMATQEREAARLRSEMSSS